jgi:mRNA interferase MazF
MKQLEVRWVDLSPPAGRRPVLLMSRTPAYAYLNSILVAEITPTVRGIPQEVLLGEQEGLPHVAVVNMDALRRIEGRFLGDRLGEIAPARHPELKRALGYALDWAELKTLV